MRRAKGDSYLERSKTSAMQAGESTLEVHMWSMARASDLRGVGPWFDCFEEPRGGGSVQIFSSA